MIHPEITEFKNLHGVDLTLGLEIVISERCEYYLPEYDHGMKYMVTGLCDDAGGLNISISDPVPVNAEMHNRFIQESDGYRIGDVLPFKP